MGKAGISGVSAEKTVFQVEILSQLLLVCNTPEQYSYIINFDDY